MRPVSSSVVVRAWLRRASWYSAGVHRWGPAGGSTGRLTQTQNVRLRPESFWFGRPGRGLETDFERPPADTEAAGRPPCELHWCGRVRHTWLPERAGKQPCCSRTGWFWSSWWSPQTSCGRAFLGWDSCPFASLPASVGSGQGSPAEESKEGRFYLDWP